MSSTNNIENPDILSPQEDIFYKQNIDLLHSNFLDKDGVAASEVLDVLKDIFTELEEKNPPNDSSIGQNPKDHTFGVLDYEKIFSLANHEQLIELFNFLTTLKEVEKNEIAPLEQLYYFISGALLHARKHEKTQLTWNSLVEYLNLDVLVRTYHVRTDFPENLRTSLSKYFKNLPNFNLHSATQEDSTYEAHFLLASKLKSVFYFATEKEITNNTELMNMLNNIMNFQPSDSKISTLRNYVTNIYYNGMANEEQVEEIDDLIEEFTSETEFGTWHEIFYNLLDSLVTKDKEAFMAATAQYVNFYWNTTYIMPAKSNKKIEFSLEKFTLEDKIVAFFTPYIEDLQIHGKSVEGRFIDLLIAYYDKDILETFMSFYNIPYNAVIRESHPYKNDKDEEQTVEHFFSLFEFCLYQEKFNITDDLLEHEEILEPFYAKIIEGNLVYEYDYKPFSDFTYMEETIMMYLIEKGVFNANTFLGLSIGDQEPMMTDIFYFLLHSNYEQAFLKLYYKSKAEDANFSLKNYQKHTTLFSLYFVLLKDHPTGIINPAVLSVFSHEKYSLYEKNADDFSAADLIKDLPIKMGVQIAALLESMFNKEQVLALTDFGVPTNNASSLLLTKNGQEEQIEWFNRDLLEEHFKRLAKEKDSPNIEYIKTMLSDNNNLRKNLLITDESFFETLDSKFPNFQEVIKFYRGQFRLKNLTGKIRIPPILLLGEPGIGKTHFAKEFAQYLKTGYTFLDMGSLTANWVLSGNNGTWKGAKQGKILESLVKSKTINPIILMDEIDKTRGGDSDPSMVLYQLLEEINAKEFTDEFVDFTFNASGIMYIACANNLQNISEALLSRFKVFNIPKPTDEQQMSIIHNMYVDATKNTNLFVERIEDSLMKKLRPYSLRAVKVIIEDAISNALLELDADALAEKLASGEKISLTASHLKDPQKKTSMGFTKS